MRSLLTGLAAAVTCFALTGSAPAHEREPHSHRPRGDARLYHRDRGVRFDHGYYYRGRDHHHWSARIWSPTYRRYHYWDPSLRCYYYWCPEHRCYYPIDYRPY